MDEQSRLMARLLPDQEMRLSMLSKFAASMRYVRARTPDWCCVNEHNSTLRLFAGRLIVLTVERNDMWVTTAPDVGAEKLSALRSWRWDQDSYPEYRRVPSRNGYYTPSLDGSEDRTAVQEAHFAYLDRVLSDGPRPDHRTRHDPLLANCIDQWFNAHERAVNEFERAVREAMNCTPEARRARLRNAPRKPPSRTIEIQVFDRNPDVVAEVLLRAAGRCEHCRAPAPFLRASDNTPYLEVHHMVRLADGGNDTVDNAMALCPNCHRQKHYG